MVRWLMGTLLAGLPAPEERAGDPRVLAALAVGAAEALDAMDLAPRVTGRVKSLESARAKAARKGMDVDGLADRVAVRLHVPTVDDCYRALDALHARYEPVPAEFDDYVIDPKPNGYRSIHTAVRVPLPDGRIEVAEAQIRTFDMHREAESGAAAHWRYKQATRLG